MLHLVALSILNRESPRTLHRKNRFHGFPIISSYDTSPTLHAEIVSSTLSHSSSPFLPFRFLVLYYVYVSVWLGSIYKEKKERKKE